MGIALNDSETVSREDLKNHIIEMYKKFNQLETNNVGGDVNRKVDWSTDNVDSDSFGIEEVRSLYMFNFLFVLYWIYLYCFALSLCGK